MLRTLQRREMLKMLGFGGLAVGAGGGLAGRSLADALSGGGRGDSPTSLGTFVAVDPSGQVHIIAHRSEMGQGIRTALAAVVAEEMEADWERVTVHQADGDLKYGSQDTDGSRSARRFYQPLREAGAAARLLLERAAAARWGVPAGQCRARAHEVHHEPSKRRLAFGELAEAAGALPAPRRADLRLKDPSTFRYVGRGVPSVDLMAMTTGTAAFGADIRRPGMLTAVIARPPSIGASWTSYDKDAAMAVSGVREVVELPTIQMPTGFQPLGGVAVVADHTWASLKGRKALNVQWGRGPHSSYESAAYRQALEEAVTQPGKVHRAQGDFERAHAAAASKLQADYYMPHLAQAPMEPPAAVAEWKDGAVELWAPTQHPIAMRDEVAQALSIDKEKVTVHVTFLGGGFGRKSKPDFGVEAALLSRRMERPVRVQWTREDDLRHGFYHAVSAQRLEAGLDAEGRVVAFRHRTAQPTISATFAPNQEHPNQIEKGMGLVENLFRIPHFQVESGAAVAHVRIGWMRAVANLYHCFAVGSFVDEIARRAERSPVEVYRELLLGDPAHLTAADLGVRQVWNYGESLSDFPFDTHRMVHVLEKVADEFGWSRPTPDGVGKGIAVWRSFVSYVAVALEVEVRHRRVVVRRAHIGIDCGKVLDEDRVRAQLEGSVAFGLSLALDGKIEMRDGATVQGNFDHYPIARISQVPRDLVTHIVDSPHRPAGVGEPGVPPVAPALTNAIYDAVGERIHALPLSDAGFRTL